MNTVLIPISEEDFFAKMGSIIEEKLRARTAQQPDKPQGEALPELFSRKQAAGFLGVSLGTIDNLARAGLLQKHYLGSIPKFKRKELLQAFESWQKFQRR